MTMPSRRKRQAARRNRIDATTKENNDRQKRSHPVETIIEEFGREDMSLHNLIENQLQSLKRLSMRANTLEDYNPVLHMDDDQYNAYSTITTFLGATQRTNAQRLFFVTGLAGVGKSYLLSALER